MEKINNFILKNEKKLLFGIILIASLYIFSLALTIDNQWCQDSHWFMSLTKNLGEGNGYSLDRTYSHGLVPPGFVLLLLPFYLILSNIHLAGMILVGLLSLATLFITYKFGKLFSPTIGLLGAFLLMIHNLFIFNSISIMTEIPFMFFSILGLYLYIKGFEKKEYFLFAFPVLAFTVLIRYSGAVLLFAMLYYAYLKKEKLKKIIFNDKFLIGFFIGFLIIFLWLLRNFIVFGNPFHTSYSNQEFQGLLNYYTFLKLFFSLGFIFPYFSLIGIYFSLKEKNAILKSMLIYFLGFFILHGYWFKGGIFRFYSEVLPILCIFSAIGIISLIKKINFTRKKPLLYLIIISLLILFSQTYIFFSGTFNYETTHDTLNRYGSIKQLSSWTNENLPYDSDFIVSDVAVYSIYLDKKNILYATDGLNKILSTGSFQNTFILTDTLHIWMTEPFLEGEDGLIEIPLQNKQVLMLNTDLIQKFEYKDNYAILLNITNAQIGTYN